MLQPLAGSSKLGNSDMVISPFIRYPKTDSWKTSFLEVKENADEVICIAVPLHLADHERKIIFDDALASGFKFAFFVYKPIARAIGFKAWKPNLCSFGQNWRSDIVFIDISEGEFSWVGYEEYNDGRVKGYLYDKELIKITSSPQEFCKAMDDFLIKKFATFCHEYHTHNKIRAVVIEGSHVFLSELKSHLKATWYDLNVYEIDSEVTTLGAAAICYQLLNDTEVVVSSKNLKFSLKDNGCHVCWKGSDAGGRWNAANYEFKSGKNEKKIVINADVPKWGYCALREPALCNMSNCYGEHNCKFCSYKRNRSVAHGL